MEAESSSSSPDPLGQPDLSSPPKPHSSRHRRLNRDIILTTPTPSTRHTSPIQNVEYCERTLSPWQILFTVHAEQEQEMSPHLAPGAQRRSPSKSPSKPFLADTIVRTIPVKSGDEIPKQPGRRRSTTPRRKGTPLPKRRTNALEQEDESQEKKMSSPPTPTPKRKRPGHLTKTAQAEESVQAGTKIPPFRFDPPDEVLVAPGASPGKRRRIVSDTKRIPSPAAATEMQVQGGVDEGAALIHEPEVPLRGSQGQDEALRTLSQSDFGSDGMLRNSKATMSSQLVSKQPITIDPTEEHDEFDSILESEDFTMVSLSSIPSGQHLQSLTRGPPAVAVFTSNDPDKSNSSTQPPRRPTSSPSMSASRLQSSSRDPSRSLLADLGPGTRRELRVGLRLGEELAKRQVQAKQAAAAVEDATEDVFAELAATESSKLSNAYTDNVDWDTRTASKLSVEPKYPELPRQLPSPEQSEDQELSLDQGNEMSWRYDTPARARLLTSLSGPELQRQAQVDDQMDENEIDEQEENRAQLREVCPVSSPDKQLFLEQAAAEMAQSSILATDKAIIIDSDDAGSDVSSNDEPPKLSDATQSMLADMTTDIWQEGAQESLQSSIFGDHLKTSRHEAQLPACENAKGRSQEPPQSNADKELYPPRRGKLPSLWRHESDSSVIYSDETKLPPVEDEDELVRPDKRKRSLFTPPQASKRGRYDDADYSVLSEFRNPAPQKTVTPQQTDAPPASSPLKQVRFASEDPENPYLPTTPVEARAEQITEAADRGDPKLEQRARIFNSRAPRKARRGSKTHKMSPAIRWEDKPVQPSSWLSGWLPSWFKLPKEPVFNFSLPNLSRLRTAEQELKAYTPYPPTEKFNQAKYDVLKKLYRQAKEKPFPMPEREDIVDLLDADIEWEGWSKKTNAWELGIIGAYLSTAGELAEGVTPEELARRLFGLWVAEVQKGRTGLGNGTAGLFSVNYVARRKEILARAKRLKSLAAS